MYTISPNFLLSAPSYCYSLHIWKCTITSPLLPWLYSTAVAEGSREVMIREMGGRKTALDTADSSGNTTVGSCQVSGWLRPSFLKLQGCSIDAQNICLSPACPCYAVSRICLYFCSQTIFLRPGIFSFIFLVSHPICKSASLCHTLVCLTME